MLEGLYARGADVNAQNKSSRFACEALSRNTSATNLGRLLESSRKWAKNHSCSELIIRGLQLSLRCCHLRCGRPVQHGGHQLVAAPIAAQMVSVAGSVALRVMEVSGREGGGGVVKSETID